MSLLILCSHLLCVACLSHAGATWLHMGAKDPICKTRVHRARGRNPFCLVLLGIWSSFRHLNRFSRSVSSVLVGNMSKGRCKTFDLQIYYKPRCVNSLGGFPRSYTLLDRLYKDSALEANISCSYSSFLSKDNLSGIGTLGGLTGFKDLPAWSGKRTALQQSQWFTGWHFASELYCKAS